MIKYSTVEEQLKLYENMKLKADRLGFVEIQGDLVRATEKALCFDFGKAGIGFKWFPLSKLVYFFLGVHQGYKYFAPSWCFSNRGRK